MRVVSHVHQLSEAAADDACPPSRWLQRAGRPAFFFPEHANDHGPLQVVSAWSPDHPRIAVDGSMDAGGADAHVPGNLAHWRALGVGFLDLAGKPGCDLMLESQAHKIFTKLAYS